MSEQRKRVLAGRYELEEVLGQGGMARVFKGTDTVLNRTVAVKVLSPQFAGDEQFVARFRREAQAAAALNHPNIVSVYDTGSQGDVHYIVMEYVEGRTLRDIIKQEGPLLPQRAIEIAEAVCGGLSAAHEGGLVHRDIKPGNIMITRDGEVKVMDFGIARTSTGDTLTQTASILGTASYLSPEQAQGESVDARSDIYSLGCVLYEMLTARAPFTGDSPVTIAYKHVRENPVPPSRVNADVSSSVEAVVMKCMAKNPANRYQIADELREDLARVHRGGAPLATPVLADSTEMLTRARARPDQTQMMTGGMPPDERRGGRRTWIAAIVVILILAALGVAAYFLVKTLVPPEATLKVPDVVGEKEEDAVATLEDQGFRAVVQREFNEEARKDFVFEQDPEEGAVAEEGDPVTITVSKGPKPVSVPDVVGESLEAAGEILGEAGFQIGDVTREESEEDEGTVLKQDPVAGTREQPDTFVDLVVSGGPGTVEVPSVVCDSIAQAQSEVAQAGLEFDVIGSRFSEDCPEGSVAEQTPAAGTEVEEGSTVSVVETEGPEPTPSPTITIPTP
ncbi:MAG: Stk1 family PASTA domain-containing Ser/Thr kinase [Actinomycetota bacterium]